jgi:hypothetical protein
MGNCNAVNQLSVVASKCTHTSNFVGQNPFSDADTLFAAAFYGTTYA